MKPIECKTFKENLVKRLVNSGAKINPEFIEEPEKAEFLSCSCENYMHYAWCLHVNLQAFAHDIMQDYPPLLNPKKIQAIKAGRACTATSGRPTKAKRGGALSGK